MLLRDCRLACAYINRQVDAFLAGWGQMLVPDLQRLVAEWVIQDPDLQLILLASDDVCSDHLVRKTNCGLEHCSTINQELCLAAFDKGDCCCVFPMIPIQFISYELCLRASKSCTCVFYQMPQVHRTFEVLSRCIANDSQVLYMIAEPSVELCLWAIFQSITNLSNIHTEPCKGFFKQIVAERPEAIKYIRCDLVTEKLALVAVQQRGLLLRCLPERCKTEAVCLAAVTEDWRALLHVPNQTPAQIEVALQQSRRAKRLIKLA
jgi:hypothetical protein